MKGINGKVVGYNSNYDGGDCGEQCSFVRYRNGEQKRKTQVLAFGRTDTSLYCSS
jgi:hypothetical protein